MPYKSLFSFIQSLRFWTEVFPAISCPLQQTALMPGQEKVSAHVGVGNDGQMNQGGDALAQSWVSRALARSPLGTGVRQATLGLRKCMHNRFSQRWRLVAQVLPESGKR